MSDETSRPPVCARCEGKEPLVRECRRCKGTGVDLLVITGELMWDAILDSTRSTANSKGLPTEEARERVESAKAELERITAKHQK